MKVSDNGLQKVEMENQIYAIPEELMRGSGVQVGPQPLPPPASCTLLGCSRSCPGGSHSCRGTSVCWAWSILLFLPPPGRMWGDASLPCLDTKCGGG